MRTEVIDYLKTQNLGGLATSTDLPFDDSGVPLYTKNVKRIYVDREQKNSEPLVQTLGGVNINNEATSVTISFATDAKTPLSSYDTVVSNIKGVKDITTVEGVHTRNATVETEYLNDLLITQITITFTRIS
jgi:hypothetical protein